jgi:hypothetical protein
MKNLVVRSKEALYVLPSARRRERGAGAQSKTESLPPAPFSLVIIPMCERPRARLALCHLVAQGETGPGTYDAGGDRASRPRPPQRRARSRSLMRAGTIGRLTRIHDRLLGQTYKQQV